jgi:hypothetical protein
VKTRVWNCQPDAGVAVLSNAPRGWENAMCYSRNYRIFEEQQRKAQEQAIEERRSGVIDQLLGDANKQSDKAKESPVKEIAPAK